MHRLGVYRIRLPKNYICKPPRYTTLVWRETEGDGEGDITRLVAKDADTSDSICQRTYIGRTTLKESVNHPLTVGLSRGVLKDWTFRNTSTRKHSGSHPNQSAIHRPSHLLKWQEHDTGKTYATTYTNFICPRPL